MLEWFWKTMKFCVCHRALYGGLCASHGWAALVTEKPEVYVPMLVLYGLLAWRG